MHLRFKLDRVPYKITIILFFLAIATSACTIGSAGTPTPTPTRSSVQPTPTAHLSYVALGASDAWGIGAENPAEQNWPVDLAKKLGNQTLLVNLGIPGITLHDALNAELPTALDAHPDLVTIWLAVDDLLANTPIDSYTQDLDFLLTRLQSSSPHVHIALANIPDLTLLPKFATRDENTKQFLRSQVTTYNASIEEVAQSHKVVLVDLYKQWELIVNHPEYISSDGFHPSTLGYYQLAEIFYQALKTTIHIGKS
jgi:lysophospholipase L1-like esterase